MKPPSHLHPTEAALWTALQTEHQIDDPSGLALLAQLAECSGRAREAREQIAREGMVLENGKPHPLLEVEKASQRLFLATLKALQLDIEPASAFQGRPVGHSVRRIR